MPQERPKAFSDGLPLVDSSPEALQWGVLAPERVRPDKELGEKLRLACRAVPA